MSGRNGKEGTSEDWANESFRDNAQTSSPSTRLLGVRWDKTSEETPIVLPTSVLNEAKPIVAQRLEDGGRPARMAIESGAQMKCGL